MTIIEFLGSAEDKNRHSRYRCQCECGKTVNFKDRKEVFTLYNRELYTKIWKIIYDADNVKGNIDELGDLTRDIEYVIIYGYLDSEVPLETPDSSHLKKHRLL